MLQLEFGLKSEGPDMRTKPCLVLTVEIGSAEATAYGVGAIDI